MNIKMYYLSYCPYSKKALDFLKLKDVPFEEDVCDERKEELKKLHRYPTFPQIFIDGKMIGGYTELVDLDKQRFFESKDSNLLIDKIKLGTIGESMRLFLLAENYIKSNQIEKARELLTQSLELFENLHAKKALEELE